MSRHSDITVSVVNRISTYTIRCKFDGHSVSGFKATWRRGGGTSEAPPVPEGQKKARSE